eukprot:3286266-Amphidinium_carterae.1
MDSASRSKVLGHCRSLSISLEWLHWEFNLSAQEASEQSKAGNDNRVHHLLPKMLPKWSHAI